MSEAGVIEIQTDVQTFRPIDPTAKMFRFNLVTIDFFAAEFAVGGVQAEAMAARDHSQRHLEIGTQFGGCARFTGIMAGYGQAAADRASYILETLNVIALPAME